HEMRIEPSSFGLQLGLPQGTPLDRFRAHQVALQARRQLIAQGYDDAKVDYSLIPFVRDQVDLQLTIRAGEPVRVKDVEFTGATGLDPVELRGALRALRPRRVLPPIPGVWRGWSLPPAYSPEAVDSDLARLRSLFVSKGYFDARVQIEQTDIRGTDARVRVRAEAGGPHQV